MGFENPTYDFIVDEDEKPEETRRKIKGMIEYRDDLAKSHLGVIEKEKVNFFLSYDAHIQDIRNLRDEQTKLREILREFNKIQSNKE